MSYSQRPGTIDDAIAAWLETQQGEALRHNTGQLIERYRRGATSSQVDLAAYLSARMPATYAAIRRVLDEVASIVPAFIPTSMLDVGAGPGTASWAALARWPTLLTLTMVEADRRFADLARDVARHSHLPALENAAILQARLDADQTSADLVIAAYIFAEIDEKSAAATALKLWQQTKEMMVIIEPGTPRGFARIRLAREALLQEGASVVGPCTHRQACPMSGQDWCRFVQRLQRSREHMHAKQASLSYEDESFSWVAVAREAVALEGSRVLAPPVTTKIGTTLKLCNSRGITTPLIASRDKAAYKVAKKLQWGDVY